MDEPGEASELEAKLGDKSVRLKTKHMAEFISLLMLLATGVGLVFFWQHTQQSDAALKMLAETHKTSFTELAETNKQMVREMRMQTCLFSLTESERKAEYSASAQGGGFCRWMAR